MKFILGAALSVFFLLGAARADDGPSPQELRQSREEPAHRLKTYSFDPAVPLAARIGPCPLFLNEVLQRMDGKQDYTPYAPSPEELKLLRDYLGTLPRRMTETFEERLIGIFFIKNFTGNGMTDWVVDENGKVYIWLVMNPAGLSRTLSQTLTAREASAFKGGGGVHVQAGSAYKGILYTLLHEGTHAYDYVHGLTPYTDRSVLYALRGGRGAGATWDVWDAYARPKKSADFPLRSQIKFYGLDGGPRLEARQARRLYRGLLNSPFASLYGSQSWAEDAAELVTFYHLTRVLKQPYAIVLPAEGSEKKLKLEPLRSGDALRRAERIYRALSS